MSKKSRENVQSVSKYNVTATVICFIGVLVSAYAFHVEVSAHDDSSYKAMCDISEHMACTKVFMSEYGKGFGIVGRLFGENSPLNVPNGFMGIFFYSLIGLLSLSRDSSIAKIQLVLSILSALTSVYLAYILYFILYDFCVVCVTTYVLNFTNLYCSYYKLRVLKRNDIYTLKHD